MPRTSIEDICAQIASRPEARAAVLESRSYVPALPLLEHSFHEVEARLPLSLLRAGMSQQEVNRFSLGELVLFALAAELGAYWPTLAVAWLEAGLPTNGALAKALEALSQNKHVPQGTRHRAFALAKQYSRKVSQ
jgi:hypothetical protein